MKPASKKAKLLAILLTLCMVLPVMPFSAFAAEPAAGTADFCVKSGTEAIDLLNQYKTGTVLSSWDNSSKTLTLRGIDFTTTAATALKLPVSSTIVLADGSTNTIKNGDVEINVSGKEKSNTYVNALDAAGNLTIQGETAGTVTLEVTAGKVSNSSNGWTYSSGIGVYGDLTVKGGHVTARGGRVQVSGDGGCAFSIGVNMDNNIKNKALLITGGTLTAIAGESYQLSDADDTDPQHNFSRGVYMYRGNVTVSGDGKLQAESVETMADATLLSNGLYIFVGNLFIANEGEVTASGGYGVNISDGCIQMDGGRLTAASTQAPDVNGNLGNAIYVDLGSGTTNTGSTGNITITDGTLETENGKIYISDFGAKENQGVFTVTGGTIVNSGRLDGATKINISDGSVKTWGIDADELTLSGGSLTIREPIRKNPNYDNLLVCPALEAGTLTVNGGRLDAAWDWGGFTPIVFPVDDYYGYATPLVEMPRDFHTATFNGGTTSLNTGKAGNTALKLGGQLILGDGVREIGADDNHCQLGVAPVKFMVASASDITAASVENVNFDYAHGDAPQASATVATGDADKYDIFYEEWGKLEKTDEYTTKTVAYWYSDDSWYQDGDVRLNTFEKDGKYQYYVRLEAKDGFTFSDSISAEDITLNGKSLPEGSYVLVLDEGRTCLIDYGMSMRTVRPVEEIKFNGPSTDFFIDGDKPRFTGDTYSAFYDVEYQKWEEKDNPGVGVGSTAVYDKDFSQIITKFEYGKTYNYSVYFSISDLGLEEGYRFDGNAKFYISNEEITLNSDQVKVLDGGRMIQFKNILSMTPDAPWQEIDLVEIEGATITFKAGDKPVFTGKAPENAPYIYQCEWWNAADGSGVNSVEFWDKNYEKHITAFENGMTYTYGVYIKAAQGYYFTSDTKLKINGTIYDYHLREGDPEPDNPDRMSTIWVITSLTVTPGGIRRGDVNGDGKVTVSDVVALRQLIIAGSWTEREFAAGNLDDTDESLTVSDVVALRALIVSGV